MQPLWSFLLIYLFYTTIQCSSSMIRQQLSPVNVPECVAKFTYNHSTVYMNSVIQPTLEIQTKYVTNWNVVSFHLISNNTQLLKVQQSVQGEEINHITGTWIDNITVNVLFIGKARIEVDMFNSSDNVTTKCQNHLELIIVRKPRIMDHIFNGSVALLVSVLYIIFGAALDVKVLKNLLKKPVGPAIGFLLQFLLMPLLGYGIGYCIFPDSVDMQLGLFFTGVSPSGGASNIWSVILGGNINLSILMTTISNFAAFGMMPFWIFTLGSLIFARNHMTVPYQNITIFAVSLIVPLAIGLAIQKCSPRLTRILMRLLKPASSCLILFIVVFAIITNLYLFQLFSWQIIFGGLLLPWLGYAIAWLLARLLHQNTVDSLTIAIETGIQNTGIAIFLLRFSLPPPQDDLTTVIPVSVAIMTPLPLLGIYLYKRFTSTQPKENLSNESSSSIRGM